MNPQNMLGKEKLLDKQKRLAEKRDQLKEKLRQITDSTKKSYVVPATSIFIRKGSPSSSLNPRKPLPSVVPHHSGNTSQNETSGIQQNLQAENEPPLLNALQINTVEHEIGSGDSSIGVMKSPRQSNKCTEQKEINCEQRSPRAVQSPNKCTKEITGYKEVVSSRVMKSPKQSIKITERKEVISWNAVPRVNSPKRFNEIAEPKELESETSPPTVLKTPQRKNEVAERKEVESVNMSLKVLKSPKRTEEIARYKDGVTVPKPPKTPKTPNRSDEITKQIEHENRLPRVPKCTKLNQDINTKPHNSKQGEKQQSSLRNSKRTFPKYKKLGKVDSKIVSQKRKIKKIKKKPSAADSKKYFPTRFVADYCKETDGTPFSLPLKDYSKLMHMKEEVENQMKSNMASLDATIRQIRNPETSETPNRTKNTKCFSQITQLLTTNPEDGIITNCYLTNKYLVIVQKHKISTYLKTKSPKEWTLKDSMVRKHVPNRIKELMVPCFLDNTDSIVFCDLYLDREKQKEGSILRMMQYRFLTENGRCTIIVTLGSFNVNLKHFQCNYMRRRLCTIAVSAWAPEESRSIVWIFTQSSNGSTLRCTPMIPVDHAVLSLHDISSAPSKTLLLGFGKRYFTIWNVKSGERFLFVDLSRLGHVKTMSCFYNCLMGFLFQIIAFKDVLHMVSINLGTGIFRSMRKFKVPEEQTCVNATVSDDRLIGVTKQYVICWSLRSSNILHVVKLLDNENVFFIHETLLLMTAYKFRRILYTKSTEELKRERALKNIDPDVRDGTVKESEESSSSEETTSSEK